MLLADLLIDKGQVRTRDVDKEVDALAESIRRQGLLQPIVVCKAEQKDKWEILSGQRRYLAHKLLGRDSINAVVLDARIDEAEAKAISITENLVRRNLSGPELIDGITFLYNKYGSAKAVHEATGISYQDVRQYVKFPRLNAELKELVEKGDVELKVALSAQDLVERSKGKVSERDLVKLANGMSAMSRAQRAKFLRTVTHSPKTPIDKLLAESENRGTSISQIIVTLTQEMHEALKAQAKAQKMTQDDFAAAIIARGLSG